MVDNALKIAVDPLYPPPFLQKNKRQQNLNFFTQFNNSENKFELIFDEIIVNIPIQLGWCLWAELGHPLIQPITYLF